MQTVRRLRDATVEELSTRSWFPVALFDPRANDEFAPKLHVALRASHAALPMVTSKFRPNIALSFSSNLTIKQPFQRHVKRNLIVHVTHIRRTSGHCLGTFRTGITFLAPLPTM
jgi:hypothetical protein